MIERIERGGIWECRIHLSPAEHKPSESSVCTNKSLEVRWKKHFFFFLFFFVFNSEISPNQTIETQNAEMISSLFNFLVNHPQMKCCMKMPRGPHKFPWKISLVDIFFSFNFFFFTFIFRIPPSPI